MSRPCPGRLGSRRGGRAVTTGRVVPWQTATHDAESHGTNRWLKKTPPTRYMRKSRAMRDLSAGRHLV